jgi:hypothetical protein
MRKNKGYLILNNYEIKILDEKGWNLDNPDLRRELKDKYNRFHNQWNEPSFVKIVEKLVKEGAI